MRPIIYAENQPGRPAIYEITTDAISRALGPSADGFEIVVRGADDPAPDILARSRYFVGSHFDVERVGRLGEALRIVHCTSAGVEGYLPLDWLPAGAVLTNSSGVHAEKGGAFGAMAVLMLNDRMPEHATAQGQRRWGRAKATAIRGKTVLFVGTGQLGSAISERLAAFGPRRVGLSRSGRANEAFDEVAAIDRLDELLPNADVLVLCCPLTAQTRGLMDRRRLALLPTRAGVLNIARAAVADYGALEGMLRTRQLSGAILDVFDPEPLPQDSPLWEVPNLLIVPHVSSDDAIGYVDRCLAILADNVARDLEGLPLRNVVSADLGY